MPTRVDVFQFGVGMQCSMAPDADPTSTEILNDIDTAWIECRVIFVRECIDDTHHFVQLLVCGRFAYTPLNVGSRIDTANVLQYWPHPENSPEGQCQPELLRLHY